MEIGLIIYDDIWLRTNVVNTNGVNAKVLLVDGFEQVLNMYVGETTQLCHMSMSHI